jgi:Tol biopolymer transport system component
MQARTRKVAVLVSLLLLPAGAEEAPLAATGSPGAVGAAGSKVDVRGRRVKRIRTVTPSGGRLDWSPANLVVFDRLGSDEYYDVYLMEADGSKERCLTCDAAGLPPGHHGNPAWHPSGDYIVFQSQDPPQGGRRGRGQRREVWRSTSPTPARAS